VNFDYAYILRISVPILEGTKLTLTLFAITLAFSLPLGLLTSFIRIGRFAFLRRAAAFYITVTRGTPLLLQLFFVYYGLPFFPGIKGLIVLDRFPAAALTFVFNYAAYFAEIFRGGILSVDRGQHEAARVLGFSKYQTAMKIVVPQMFKVVLPAVCNESITLVKDTALVTVLGLGELLHFAKAAVNRDSNISAFIVAGVFYLVMTTVITWVFKKLEDHFMFE